MFRYFVRLTVSEYNLLFHFRPIPVTNSTSHVASAMGAKNGNFPTNNQYSKHLQYQKNMQNAVGIGNIDFFKGFPKEKFDMHKSYYNKLPFSPTIACTEESQSKN